jgi:cytochrome c6
MTPARGSTVCAAALAAALLLGPASHAGRAATPAATITVTASDHAFKLSAKTAPAGQVTFAVKNTGKHDHSFQIAGKKTPVLKPGLSAKLVVTFGKPGSFAYSSTVAGDAARGMKGVFTAGAAASANGNVAAGRQVFVTTGCGACHALKAAGATGTIAKSLDTSKSSLATITAVITNGKGTMQSYKPLLTPAQIQDVAAFVFASRTG